MTTTFIYQVQDDTIDASVSEQPDDLSRVTIAIDVHNPQGRRVACEQISFEIAVPVQAEDYLWPFLTTNPTAITAVAVDSAHWDFSRSDYKFTARPIACQGFAGLPAGESATFLLQNVEVVPATGPTPIKIIETLADGSEARTEIILHKQAPDLRIDRFDADNYALQARGAGDSQAHLTWATTRASRVTLTAPGQAAPLSDTNEDQEYKDRESFVVQPTTTTPYTLTAVDSRSGQRVTRQLVITVKDQQVLEDGAGKVVVLATGDEAINLPDGAQEEAVLSIRARRVEGVIPRGVIVMWSGAVNAVPGGWALCNGQNGTPDLLNRFIVGAGDEYGRGDTGGADKVQLKEKEMPSHTHVWDENAGWAGRHYHRIEGTSASGLAKRVRDEDSPGNTTVDLDFGGGDNSDDRGEKWRGRANTHYAGNHTHSIPSPRRTPESERHENRPPYYALAYIMKL